MQGINLSAIARDTATESGLHDPHEIAEKVLANLSADEMVLALRVTLPEFVRGVVGSSQREAMRHVFRPNRSAKVAQRRDWWAEMLVSAVFVDGVWKAFGECSRADVGWLGDQRRVEAARNLAQAGVYDEIDQLMAEHGVSVLAELPRAVVPAALCAVSS